MVDVAEVRIWGELVGAVKWDESRQLASFQYDSKFATKGWELSPIKMPLTGRDRIYSFTDLRTKRDEQVGTFRGLPGLLADALPDRYGDQLINIWLARKGRSAGSMNPVEQLCFIGQRGMGALEFEPIQSPLAKTADALEVSSLIKVAQQMLAAKKDFTSNLTADEEKAVKDILKIGTSAGGARPKAVIAYNKNTGEIRSGQSAVPSGFEHWLLKLDGVSDVQFGKSQGWGRVEYAYYLMAKACGIEMMDCELLIENGRAHFMTKRFDREKNNVKHHVQTFCALEHFDYNNLFSYSYEQLFQTMRSLRLTYPEAEQMFKRMVFNVLATNCDDHTKNFSFRLKKGERWALSPAYDVCYAFDESNQWVSQQSLSVNGKHRSINRADLMTIATANNIKKGEKIIDQINQTVADWSDFANQAGVHQERYQEIQSNLHLI